MIKLILFALLSFFSLGVLAQDTPCQGAIDCESEMGQNPDRDTIDQDCAGMVNNTSRGGGSDTTGQEEDLGRPGDPVISN